MHANKRQRKSTASLHSSPKHSPARTQSPSDYVRIVRRSMRSVTLMSAELIAIAPCVNLERAWTRAALESELSRGKLPGSMEASDMLTLPIGAAGRASGMDALAARISWRNLSTRFRKSIVRSLTLRDMCECGEYFRSYVES